MNIQFSEESLVQKTTADYLLKNLEWNESIYAFEEKLGINGTLGRVAEQEVVLVRYLKQALEKLNPGFPAEAYKDAIRQIKEISSSTSIVAINEEKELLIKNGVTVTFRNIEGERDKKRLRVFNFDVPEENHFLIVRELWVRGDIYRRRADIVGYVNGIPLIFMEVKNVHKSIKSAYEQNLADYKDTIPRLFSFNAFIVLGNGIEAKIGSITSKFEHFSEWKRLSEDEPGAVDMETLLKGVCSKTNLLDILENFTLFDKSGGLPIKIIARNHQFLGVNKAVTAVINRKEQDGKLGVFWHTQGSGKSYSIVCFTRKVHRKLGGNFTFLVLTDREDLDTQIYETFAGCNLVNNDKDPCRAGSGRHLQELLSEHKSVVFSLIQKFNQEVKEGEPYNTRDDIIVITDEAHRTQYGTLSLNLRNALPNASFIGFTGTPLFSDDEITKRVFGDYVSTYDFQRAVDDGATVPLYYDARGEELNLTTEELNEKIAEKLEEFEISDVNVAARLERELKRDYHLITADPRLDPIAKDFVEHYSEGWENGKAMFVCIDKVTCVRMHKKIQASWKKHIEKLEKNLDKISDEQEFVFRSRQLKWMKETRIEVMVSEEQGEIEKFNKWDIDIKPYRTLIKEGFIDAEGNRIKLEDAFKKADHPFRVVIVCAMWLTGFDVPCLGTLYLDKPLKAHTLMQAIARANRVDEGKNNGLIVDYCGILKNLRKALATFAGQKDSGHKGPETGQDPTRDKEELLSQLEESIQMTISFLASQGFKIDKIFNEEGFGKNAAINAAKEAVNENDRTRKKFEILARKVFKLFKACINIRPEINNFRSMRNAINIIYQKLHQETESKDISDFIRELHKVVEKEIETKNIKPNSSLNNPDYLAKDDPNNLYDISKIDFERLKQEFARSPQKRTLVQHLKNEIENRLQNLLRKNPLRTDFQKHYEKIVEEYNSEKDKVTIEKTFEALFVFEQSLSDEEKRAVREGLNEESLAFFDLLKKPKLENKQIKQLKEVAANLLAILKEEKLKVENWREKESTRDAVRQNIYDFLYDENSGLPVDSYEEEEIDILSQAIFDHVYRNYPTVPSPYYELHV
ncbi:MAG: type I restriction endonuclease subunit R [Candidatus Rifleibacteriota bacterium]